MKDGKKKQFDERRQKTAVTREGKEEQKTCRRWFDFTDVGRGQMGFFLFFNQLIHLIE